MGKTITTYLIDGNPQGVQNLFLSNNICNLTVIPRSSLSIMNSRKELQNPALYILIGEDEENREPKAYIGETENFVERIKDHEINKPFWNKVLVFSSKDGAMTKVDVQYLEHLAYALAKKLKKFNLFENKQTPKAPNLPEHLESNNKEFFEDVITLTTFVGCNIFEKVEKKESTTFYLKSAKANAKGFYNASGFTVLEGSIINLITSRSFTGKEKREIWLNEYTNKVKDDLVLLSDYTFKSPSAASDYCTGNNTNGWDYWKDEKGQSLNDVIRKKLD
jgi:Domain of unknown function (DUF4357)